MSKKGAILILLLFVIVTSIFIVDQMKYTTYEAIMLEMLDDGEMIIRIEILNMRTGLTFITEDEEVIKKIM